MRRSKADFEVPFGNPCWNYGTNMGTRHMKANRLQQGINQIGKDPTLLREQARLFYLTRDLRSAMEILRYLAMVNPDDASVLNNLNVVTAELAGIKD